MLEFFTLRRFIEFLITKQGDLSSCLIFSADIILILNNQIVLVLPLLITSALFGIRVHF